MFWTCRNHRPLAKLVHECNYGFLAGKPVTCRPSLTKSTQQYQQPLSQSSFFKSSHSLPAEMKKVSVCLYRSYHKSRSHVFGESFNKNSRGSQFLTGTRNLSSYWHRSLFQDHDNANNSKTKDLFRFPYPLPNHLARPAHHYCPHHVVSKSYFSLSLTFKTSLFLNPRLLRPCISHSSDAKFYGTQTNNSSNPQPTSSQIHLDNTNNTESKKSPLTADLKENIQTIPNLLTCCRMASAPFLSYLILNGSFSWALGLLVFAGITDLLDGFIARNFKNQNTMLGTALDPFADKILISFLTVSLTMVDLIPLPLLLVIIGRDLGLIGIFFYIRYVTLPPPKTIKRYCDITHSTAEISPSFLSKANTAIQLSLLALSVAAPVVGYVDHILLQSLWYVTASTTILSACDYVRERKKVIKILGENSNSN